MDNRIPFHKTYTNSHDLVNLLQSRGLAVAEPTKAERYLEYIGYYRLSAYMYPLLQIPKEQHQYKQGAKFSQVMTLYRFDKKLRLFLFNEIDKVWTSVSAADWTSMQAVGAVFLPAAGERSMFIGGIQITGVGNYGNYWSSSAYGSESAYYVCFGNGINVRPSDYYRRDSGYSVRLVHDKD